MADLIDPSYVKDRKLLARADLADLISAASTRIETECHRSFALATSTEAYDGTARGRILLARLPVAAVTAITINGTDLDNTDGTAWTFKPASGELFRGGGHDDPRFAAPFPRGVQNVLVTYSAGYSPIPADLQRACLILVKQLADLTKVTGMYKSESIGDYSYEINPEAVDIPPYVASVIRNYQL